MVDLMTIQRLARAATEKRLLRKEGVHQLSGAASALPAKKFIPRIPAPLKRPTVQKQQTQLQQKQQQLMLQRQGKDKNKRRKKEDKKEKNAERGLERNIKENHSQIANPTGIDVSASYSNSHEASTADQSSVIGPSHRANMRSQTKTNANNRARCVFAASGGGITGANGGSERASSNLREGDRTNKISPPLPPHSPAKKKYASANFKSRLHFLMMRKTGRKWAESPIKSGQKMVFRKWKKMVHYTALNADKGDCLCLCLCMCRVCVCVCVYFFPVSVPVPVPAPVPVPVPVSMSLVCQFDFVSVSVSVLCLCPVYFYNCVLSASVSVSVSRSVSASVCLRLSISVSVFLFMSLSVHTYVGDSTTGTERLCVCFVVHGPE